MTLIDINMLIFIMPIPLVATSIANNLDQKTMIEHPFAQYVRILGKGKLGSRNLSYSEAYAAFNMILNNDVENLQLGAFLSLLRIKAESADELHAFVQASKDHFSKTISDPIHTLQVDLDWSSYAGKSKHYPWYILAALTLAKHGVRIIMHGAAHHTAGRVYSEDILPLLGHPICQSIQQAQDRLETTHFAYIPLKILSPKLAQIIGFRQLLGLRSPVHTLARLFNPFNANTTLQSIFHPAYRASHQQAALQLGYQNAVVMKGEGGEFERNPDANTLVLGIKNGLPYEDEWEMLNDTRSTNESYLDLSQLNQVWQGTLPHNYGEQAVIATLAIVLIALQKAETQPEAMKLAAQLWESRF